MGSRGDFGMKAGGEAGISDTCGLERIGVLFLPISRCWDEIGWTTSWTSFSAGGTAGPTFALLAYELNHAFQVKSLGKQIDEMNLLHAVSGREQWDQVAGQSGWIARDISNA